MNILLRWSLPFAVLLISVLFSVSVHAARDDEDDWDDEMEEVSAEELQMQDIPVDERIFIKRWNRVPFDARHFTYTPEQIEQRWDALTRALKIPYPSEEFLRRQFERYPWLADEIEGFDGDYAALHHRYLQIGQLFLAGDFQAAREQGMRLGAAGRGLAMLSQTVYAIYLADSQSEKHMLLQDVVNTARKYLPQLEDMEKDPEVAPYAILVRLGYTYALARIAEEVPIPVAVARNYIPRIKHNADEILVMMPEHALAHALRAGVDAGIVRRVGKFTGRVTYRARTTVVTASFDKAEQYVPDMALILYEKANAMVYVNKQRQLDAAIALLERAAYVRPSFAMEALDSMYAHRRLGELQLYLSDYPSFRRFDRVRRRFARHTDINLTSVLAPALTHEMLQDPKRYLSSL